MDHYTATTALPLFKRAGIVGNFMGEDFPDLRVAAIGDKSLGDEHEAHGIGQWRDGRWLSLQAYAKARKDDPNDLFVQLDFALYEMTTTERTAGAKMAVAKTVEDAVEAMLFYERPAGFSRFSPRTCSAFNKRLAFAKSLME
jgi:hypothetical protein